MIKYIFFNVFCLFAVVLYTQDLSYARKIVDTLASSSMFGRGYVNAGDSLAAQFIADEYKKFKLNSFTENTYFQYYTLPINTFSDSIIISINNHILQGGKDFYIAAFSGSLNAEKKIIRINEKLLKSNRFKKKALKIDFSEKVIIADGNLKQKLQSNPFKAAAVFFEFKELPAWSISNGNKQEQWLEANIIKNSIPKKVKKVKILTKSVFYDNYITRNVIGYIPGYAVKDSFIVVTAHYDHLGCMGKGVYFPGANDNASGVALMLDIARYYSEKKDSLPYSIVFIAFSGEEAGLLGSFYFVNNPLFPLKNVKLLLNLDMVGTGSKGIKVVNATEFVDLFNKFISINDSCKYLSVIEKRGSAANSDHYPFYERGVPSFFIYTLGDEYKEYHNIYDKADKLPFTAYDGLFRLIVNFFKYL